MSAQLSAGRLGDGTARPSLRLRWEAHDRHGAITFFAIVGVLGAVAMALFGLPPADIHGPLHYIGIMDPLCGMTRAFRLLARGQLDRAVTYNPASPLLAVVLVGVVIRAAIGKTSGRWLDITVVRSRGMYLVIGLGIAALWINQQIHAGLLMQTH